MKDRAFIHSAIGGVFAGLLVFTYGCTTFVRNGESNDGEKRSVFEDKPSKAAIAGLADYYVKAGIASDMTEALRMAKDYYWAEEVDENSLLGKQEARMDEIRRQAEERAKK